METNIKKTTILNHSHVHNDEFDHEHEHEHERAKLWKLIIGTAILIPTLVFLFVEFDPLIKTWMLFSFSTFLMIVIFPDFLLPAIIGLKNKYLSLNLLVSIAAFAAYAFSITEFALNYNEWISGTATGMLFFEASIEILVIIYIGRYIESFLTKRTSKEIDSLKNLIPETAIRLNGENEEIVNIHDLKINDIVLIRLGSKIPSDGIVIEGTTSIDESLFTGESIPIEKKLESNVYAGTISLTGTIKIKITKQHHDSMIMKIVDGISVAQQAKPKTQKIADKISKYFIPAILVIAITAFLSYGVAGHLALTPNAWYAAFSVMITVLVIACPCSFGITTPMSILAASSVSTKKGIIFNSKEVFEKATKIDFVCFDKTGTLTEGKLKVSEVNLPKDIFDLVINVERKSNHPIAKAIVSSTPLFSTISNFDLTELPGQGLQVVYKNETYFIGSSNFIKQKNNSFELASEIVEKRKKGDLFVFVSTEKKLIGYITLKDNLKKEAREVVQFLLKKGIGVKLISGDNKDTANYIGELLGIKTENIHAEIMPLDKSKIISELQNDGRKVVFVGDGINDSVALKTSNLGIAIGAGADIAKESAAITIQRDDLTLIIDSLTIIKATSKNIYRGFTIAFLYNATMVPLAVSGLSFVGPVFAGVSMMFSDTIAIFNAMTLKIFNKKRFSHKRKNQNETKK